MDLHRRVVATLVDAGVERVVYTSFLGAAPDASFTFARRARPDRAAILEAGCPTPPCATRCTSSSRRCSCEAGVIAGPAGDGRVALVARDDIADVAAAVLTDRRAQGQTYDVTGEEAISLAETAEVLAEDRGPAGPLRGGDGGAGEGLARRTLRTGRSTDGSGRTSPSPPARSGSTSHSAGAPDRPPAVDPPRAAARRTRAHRPADEGRIAPWQRSPPPRSATRRSTSCAARGLTTIFSNPGSTEVPLLAGLPDDLRFVLALHEGSVVGDGHRLRDRPRRARARAPAHDRRARQRGRRARHRARQPRAARRPRRPAGPPAPRARAVPGRPPATASRASTRCGSTSRCARRTCRARSPAPTTRPRPAAGRRSSSCRWTTGSRRAAEPHEALAPGALSALRGRRPGRGRASSPRCSRAPSRPALVVGAGADDAGTLGRRSSRSPSASAAPSGRSRSARAPASRRTIRCFAGHLPAGRARLREALAGHDLVLVVGAPRFRQYPYEPGPLRRAGHARRGRHRRPRRGAPQPGRARRARPTPAAVCAALAERSCRRATPDAAPRPRARRAGAARRRRAAARRPRARRAGRAAARRRDRGRGDARRAAPSCTRASPPARRSASSARRWAASASRCPPRSALRMALPDRPVVAVVGDGSSLYADPGAVERGPLRRRRAVRRPRQRPLRDHGPPRRDAAAAHGPWPAFEEVDVAAIARGFGCPAQRISDHDELLRVLDDVIPTLAQRREPLLLSVDIAP